MSSSPEASSSSDTENTAVTSEDRTEGNAEEDVESIADSLSEPGEGEDEESQGSGHVDKDQPPPEEPKEITPSAAVVPKKHDRYGWNKADRRLTRKESRLIQTYEAKEEERARKWGKMFVHFAKFRVFHRATYEERVKKGIPDTWRSRAWVWILDKIAEKEERERKRTRRDVMFYFNKGVPDGDEVIRNDIPRTMPTNQMFFTEDTKERFYRILRAYTNASPQFGYVQGMAFPAAMLIAYIPDDYQVFWAFMHLMNGERIGLARLYQGDFIGLRKLNDVWDCLLKKKHRDIWKNLNTLNIEHMMYTTTYFLCAFMNCPFPTFLRLRIFDRFVCSGFRALVSLALAFMEMHKKTLKSCEFEDVLPLLRNPPCDDFSVILSLWDKEWLSEEEFDKWCSKAKVTFKTDQKRKVTL